MLEQMEHPLPARAALRPDGLYLALREIRAEELRDGFMQETIARVPAPEAVVRIARDDIGKVAAATAPAGLVFHVARCGSTLLAQMLKAHDGFVVYSEPLPCNEILVPPHPWPRRDLVLALRSLGDAFARHARKPYVLKFSSWNTLFCDIVAEAFPAAPWILVVRDPVEVGVSLLHQPPAWMSGTGGTAGELRRIVDPQGESSGPEEFVARLYGAFCAAAARLDTARGRLVTYESLPSAAWQVVAPHFSAPAGSRQLERMTAAANIDSKARVGEARRFAGDSAAKQALASATLRAAVDTFARPPLQALVERHAAR